MPAAAAVLHQHGWRTIRRDVFLISHESHLLLLPFTNSKQAFRFFYFFFTNVAFLLFLSISLRFWLASNSVHICQIGDNLAWLKPCELWPFFIFLLRRKLELWRYWSKRKFADRFSWKYGQLGQHPRQHWALYRDLARNNGPNAHQYVQTFS